MIKYRYNVLAEMVSAEKTLETKKNAVKQDMTEIANAEQAARFFFVENYIIEKQGLCVLFFHCMFSTATATYERVNSCFKEEMARFEATKGKEIAKSIARLGKMLVTYHLKSADAFRALALME